MKGHTLLFLCIWLFAGLVGAQTKQERKQYLKEAGNFSLLYQGKLEEGYRRGYVNTPYFPDEYVMGSIVYGDVAYTDVPMHLDCYTGRIIVQAPNRLYNIALLTEMAPRVTIGNRDYVFFSKKKEQAPADTYFVALYESEVWGIYKQYYISNIKQNLEQGKVRKEFSLKQRIYLKKGNRWTEMSGKDDFIKQFKTHKVELKSYCKQKKLRPSEKREKDWEVLARYCETLTK